MKTVKVKIVFQTSRVITQQEGLFFWEHCARFSSAPGHYTYQAVWMMTDDNGEGKVTEDDKIEAGVTALERLDALIVELNDITHTVCDVVTLAR